MASRELTRKRAVPFPLYEVDLFSASPEELREMSKTMGSTPSGGAGCGKGILQGPGAAAY